ncbi:hypothetical protein L3Q82_015684 [Scortum barcoo]|uniref:Uncharacterized protein n=1 Tax=Scortum barcoo TaxID=214431 RepID=A0ACB8VNM5_9TELE|nr:hypothetical protein L3Q82_015684 [Scortum barcoo]
MSFDTHIKHISRGTFSSDFFHWEDRSADSGPVGLMGSPKSGMQEGGHGGGMRGIGGGGKGGMGGGVGRGGIGVGMGSGGVTGSRAGEPYRLATHEHPISSRHVQSSQGPSIGQGPGSGHGMGHGPAGSSTGAHGSSGLQASRRNLQVDFSGSAGSRTGRPPSVSPDCGITPTSPYSVPQIAPMPSSKLCPVCTTTELSNPPAVPNYNTCTQCKATVCNQCGFNPNPHLTEVAPPCSSLLLTTHQVRNALKKNRARKAAGPDSTDPRCVKESSLSRVLNSATITRESSFMPTTELARLISLSSLDVSFLGYAAPPAHHSVKEDTGNHRLVAAVRCPVQFIVQPQPEVQEWLCLNCQMQRALGIDMTTPRSKSQQQIHSPSHQAKPIVQPQQPSPQSTQPATAAQPKPLAQCQPTQQQLQPQSQPYSQTQPQTEPYSQSYPASQPGPQTQSRTSPGLERHLGPGGPLTQTRPLQQGMISNPYSETGPGAAEAVRDPNQFGAPRIPHPGAVPLPGLTKAPSQPDLGRGSLMHQSTAQHNIQTRSAGSSPAHRPQNQPPPLAQDGLTKLFGFGASLLNQASTLISADPLPTVSTQPSPARGKVVFSNLTPANKQHQQGAPATKPFGMVGPEMGGPHGTSKMGGSHLPSHEGGAYPPILEAPNQIEGPKMGGPHAPTQRQQPMPHQQGMPQQQLPVYHQKGPQGQQLQQQGQHYQQIPAHLREAVQKQESKAAPLLPPDPVKPKVNCPLCKTELNIGSFDPPNYNTCTQCHSEVCNLCGFNPTPHLVESGGDSTASVQGLDRRGSLATTATQTTLHRPLMDLPVGGYLRVHREFAQTVNMCFVDLEKPFNHVPSGILWGVLSEYGVWGPKEQELGSHCRQDRVRSSITREELGVEQLLLCIERSQLRWPGHLFQMPPEGVPGMSHREEAPGKIQDTLERLCLSAGLGMPQNPPGRAVGSVWDVTESGDAVENVLLPATSSSMTRFGSGSVMVWGGISLGGRTALHVLARGSLTAIRYRDEILRPLVRPYAGAVGPGFLLMQDNARPHVAGVCQQFLQDKGIDAMDWPARSPGLNPIEHIWDIMSRSIHQRHVAPQTVQELADALVQGSNRTNPTGSCKTCGKQAQMALSKLKVPDPCPILTIPDLQKQFVVEVDASNEDIGALLSQRSEKATTTNSTCRLSLAVLSVFQKKEWLCLNCQTQRLMSGGGLDDPPLPVPHQSPKHQQRGSLHHQVPTSQQSPLHKPTNQQGSRPVQSQIQKPHTGGSGTFAATAAKQLTDTKTMATVPTTETQKQLKLTEEHPMTEHENQIVKETKPTQKKGEQITPIKDIKKSKHCDRLGCMTTYRTLWTRDNKALDLLFANAKDTYSCQWQPLITRTVRRWSQEAEQTLQGCFDTTDWDVLCEAQGEDIGKLIDCITDYDIKDALNRKKAAFRRGDKEELKKVQTELREKIADGKDSYRRKLESRLQKNNMREVWSGFKTTTGHGKKASQMMEGDLLEANKLNHLSLLRPIPPRRPCTLPCTTSRRHISPPAPTGHIFNLSLIQMVVPDHWKTSCLVPVPKKKHHPSTHSDYRPVALTSHVMKSLRGSYLGTFAHSRRIIVGPPAVCLPAPVYTHLEEAGSTVRVMFFDFSSAFNTIPALLYRKLLDMQVDAPLVAWIHNYLTGQAAFGSATKQVRNRLQRTVTTEEKIIGANLPSIQDSYVSRVRKRTGSPLRATFRPGPLCSKLPAYEGSSGPSDSAVDVPETAPNDARGAELAHSCGRVPVLWPDWPFSACLPVETKRPGLSWAEEDFLDQQVAARAVDRRVLARVTHRTQPLTLVVSGYPWLAAHNPHLDWAEGTPVTQVLQLLLENRLYIKKEKCEFHASGSAFWGFIIERVQVQADPEKVYPELQLPHSPPLTSPAHPFQWGLEADHAFNQLKCLFTSAPVLSLILPLSLWSKSMRRMSVEAILSQRQGPDARLNPCQARAWRSRCAVSRSNNHLYVPGPVCAEVHSSKLACHPAMNQTQSLVKCVFWWPTVEGDVRDYVLAYSNCARSKSAHTPPAGLLQPLPVPPWSHIALYFIMGLPSSANNTSVVTIVDRFSKAAHFVALPKLPSACETADLLTVHVIRLHCIPQDIVSDHGPHVESHGEPDGQEEELAVPSVQHHFQHCWAVWQQTRTALEETTKRNQWTADKRQSPDNLINPSAVRLKLPASMHIHPTFHVSQLKPVVTSPLISTPGLTCTPTVCFTTIESNHSSLSLIATPRPPLGIIGCLLRPALHSTSSSASLAFHRQLRLCPLSGLSAQRSIASLASETLRDTKNNSTHDLSRSPQSLSDTGYSSDGISSSHSEITGLIHEEEMKLSEKGVSGQSSPPSPSEITKLESSMRPLLEKSLSEEKVDRRGRKLKDRDLDDRGKQRPRSLSIPPDVYDSDEDLEDILEEEEDGGDWESKWKEGKEEKKEKKNKEKEEPTEMTDEEFMRRQIMEMSADEENEEEEEEEEDEEDEGYGYQKPKKSHHKHIISDSGKEKRRLQHHSSSFEEETKSSADVYKCSVEEGEEDVIASQGGLRRFKTIELNNTNSYSRDMELSNENDLSLEREPELEMESLTGSPEDRSRGDYSSTLPATSSSYGSGQSPTSISSMEEDSDSSPSRRQRLEEAKQQRKARHRSHGPLLPTIEDSSEEDELREEEELLREQEKMREVEQQRIRSTARKTKRDKEELRAQRRRERSKTPPSNLSPIEDASPTEELRQAAEMEELHRSSASEYSPQSLDSEAEGYESKLYKSGSEYNLPTFISLYSPIEKSSSTTTTTAPSSISKPLKSAEEVYEEMMRKAELLQKQQKQQQHGRHGQYYEGDVNGQGYDDEFEYEPDHTGYNSEPAETETDIYKEIRQTSQNITKMQQATNEQVEIEIESSYSDKQLLDTGPAFTKLLEQSNTLLTPGTSPTQISAPVSFADTGGRIPDVRVTQHFSAKDGHKERIKSQAGKNGITPAVAATTIAAYGVYAREAVTTSQTSSSTTVISTQSGIYVRPTGSPATSSASVSSVFSKIAEITQAYSQREVITRRIGESRGVQMRDSSTSSTERIIEPCSPKYATYHRSSSPPLSPSSPSQSPTRSPSRRATAEFSTQTFNSTLRMESAVSGPTSPVMAQGTQTSYRSVSPRLYRQQSSQDSPYSPPPSPARPMTVNTATSPLSSPTRFSRQSTFDSYSPCSSPPDTPPYQQSPTRSFYRTHRVEKVNVGTSMVTIASTYTRGSVSMDNISLCRISTVPGTSRVEQGHMIQGGSVVDLTTATKTAPIIMTDQGMDLTSLATESRKYHGSEGSRLSTIVQPLIMNLNTQETTTPTTVSVTVAASMFMTQPKQPTVYGDPHQNQVDLGHGVGSAMCLSQNKPPILTPADPSIPKIDAKLEDLSVQQRELQKQQEKLQKQQELLEQQLQQHHQMQQLQQASALARYNLTGQVLPLLKKDLLVSQMSSTSTVVSAVSSSVINPELYGSGPIKLKGKPSPPGLKTGCKSPHSMIVQMDGGPEQTRVVTELMKVEEGEDAIDLAGGQIKSDNQPACCDVVYRLPFSGSCVGGSEGMRPPSAPPCTYESDQERQTGNYNEYSMDGHKAYTLPFPGRLQPSISDTNLAEAGLQSYHSKLEPQLQASGEVAMDLTALKQGYGGYMGLQYGSYTDLRHGGDITAQTLPIRRYNSLSNISSDYGYSARDIASFQEANLAQYSATTAREISRMCAALNSIDRYGSNPDLMQFSSLGRGTGPGASRLAVGLGMRQNLFFGLDGKAISHSQALTNLINARQASLRAMYPAAFRSSDGMIYSTIQTPIASTLPITTQPASVLRPLLRGVYRPYPSANMTPLPLSSLSRLPVSPRMPLSGHGPVHYPAPGIFQTALATASTAPGTTPAPIVAPVSVSMTTCSTAGQNEPVYLGKGATVTSLSAEVTSVQGVVVIPMETQQQPVNLSQAHLNGQQQQQMTISQQPQQPPAAANVYPPPAQSHTHSYTQAPVGPSAPPSGLPIPGGLPPFPPPGAIHKEGESEAERLHRQQEQLLQMERERVELEKLRQLRLQEELERERLDLKLHREKEQILVQRELQELQNIKEQPGAMVNGGDFSRLTWKHGVKVGAGSPCSMEVVALAVGELIGHGSVKSAACMNNAVILFVEKVLQQQQQEREKQLVLQREQLAQQKSQLDQIQSLQQQLQQQLVEQKRQKTAAAAAQSMQLEVTGQPLHPYNDSQMGTRSLPNSSSETCLRSQEEYMETRSNMRKHSSMTRLSRDSLDGDSIVFYGTPHRIMDSCVQTDDEDRKESGSGENAAEEDQSQGKPQGPDGISSRLLWDCADQLFPKTSRPKEPNHFRPVALTSHLMKALERIVLRHLRPLVSPNMDPLQFAYQPGIGVDDAIIYLLQVRQGSLQQVDDGIIHPNAGLVCKLQGIHVWAHQGAEVPEDDPLQCLHQGVKRLGEGGGGGEEHCRDGGEGGGDGESPRDGGGVDGGEGACRQRELEVGWYIMRHRTRRRGRSVDCSVQTDDDEDMAEMEQPVRRRRSRFLRHSESSATGSSTAPTTTVTDTKTDTSKMVSSSIAIQTIREMSCQTETEHLGRVSPAIHVTVPDPNKVEIVHYISGPERTKKGQSLACQTDPEGQSQGVVVPQLSVSTTVNPYTSSISTGMQQSSSADPLTQQRQQQFIAANAAKFERRRPDPLDINYQPHNHLHNDSISTIIRQQQTAPKSPQVLYSPVSPVSPHRLLETSVSSERLNKAHVTPQQKSYTAESPQRHPSVPRPIKSTQRSMSDPKPLSPTTDEHTKARLSLYQQQALQSQVNLVRTEGQWKSQEPQAGGLEAGWRQNRASLAGSLKDNHTDEPAQEDGAQGWQQSWQPYSRAHCSVRSSEANLPSPPPEETTTSAHLPMMTPALQQVYLPSVPSLKHSSRSGLAAKASLLKDLTHELKAVEQESTKLRKQQAELEEEEKEIDAKLRYLELGIHQRKETLVKERERRDIAYLRCMGDTRDYMSDSELNNLRLAAAAASHETNGLLSTRPSTAPLSQFASDLNTAVQYPPNSSFLSCQYSQSQPAAPTQQSSLSYQSSSFNQPPYPTVSQSQALPQPTPLQSHVPSGPSFQSQISYPSHTYPQPQPPYPQTDMGLAAAPQSQSQVGHTGFGTALPGQPPYPTHSSPYPSAVSSYTSQTTPYPGQSQADILTVHLGRPRQTSLSDLEHKMPTNYETISNPTVMVTTTAQDTTYSSTAPSYGQYTGSTTMASSYVPYGSAPVSSSYSAYSTMPPSTYGQYTSTSANSFGQYTTTTTNTYGYTNTTASSYGQYTSTVSNTYGHSVDSPSMYSTTDAMYGAPGLEQNIPRNYMMIDDVSELTTKDGLGTMTGDMMHHGGSGRYPGDIHGHSSTIGSTTRGGTGNSLYGRASEEEAAMQEELYDHHGRGKSSYRHGPLGGSSSSVSASMGGGSPYYFDYDYKHGSIRSAIQKNSSSSRSLLAPAVMSTRRSKHRKLGSVEQKISKFSPIEEARDVEADLASYSSATGGVYPSTHIRGRQLIEDYGFKRSAYEASGAATHGSQYCGSMLEEDDRIYYTPTGRSRSTGYGMDKISARDYSGYRSRSYERDDRSYRSDLLQPGAPPNPAVL